MDEPKTKKNGEIKGEPQTDAHSAARGAPVNEPVFSLPALRQDCARLFGVSASTFDGATYGLNGSFTILQIRKIIEGWQNKPVRLPNGKENK